MYLVIGLSSSEFRNASDDRPVKKFSQRDEVLKYLATYQGDISRLDIYEATPMSFTLDLKAKA